jgi:hypothetical protein
MKILAASLFAIGVSLAAMSGSQAMPLAPLDQAASSDTIRVAGGCGPGWHRGPYGGCRPMYNCPPGWHSGPFGRRCFRTGEDAREGGNSRPLCFRAFESRQTKTPPERGFAVIDNVRSHSGRQRP